MRKAFPVAFISLLLFSVLAGTQLVNFGKATPYHFRLMEEAPPDANTEPPKIEIFSPENNTSYNTSHTRLQLNESVGDSSSAASRFLWSIQFETDWQQERVCVYERIPETNMPSLTEFSTAINLTGYPMERIPSEFLLLKEVNMKSRIQVAQVLQHFTILLK